MIYYKDIEKFQEDWRSCIDDMGWDAYTFANQDEIEKWYEQLTCKRIAALYYASTRDQSIQLYLTMKFGSEIQRYDACRK